VGVEQKLWAKALAIGSDREGPAVLITLDNCGIAEETYREVGKRLARAARHVVFGEKISASGAAPKAAKRAIGGVDVTLGDYDGQLLVIGARDPAGFELCGDAQASFAGAVPVFET